MMETDVGGELIYALSSITQGFILFFLLKDYSGQCRMFSFLCAEWEVKNNLCAVSFLCKRAPET